MKVLCIGAHIDECEYGVGGVTAMLLKRGHSVRWLNPATYLHISDERRPEMQAQSDAAAAVFEGLEKVVWKNGRRDRTWVCTLENIMGIQNEIESCKPDILFIQWPKDNHPEHAQVAKASYYAMSNALTVGIHEVYAFEAGEDQTMNFFVPDFSIDITEGFDTAVRALRCYATAHADGDWLAHEKQVCAAFRGLQNRQNLAEAFRIVKFPDGHDDFYLRGIMGDAFRWWGCRQYPAFGREYF